MLYTLNAPDYALRNRVKGFVRYVIPAYTPDEYRSHFRMSRVTMQAVYEGLSGVINTNNLVCLSQLIYGGGRKEVHLQTKLLLFVWFLSNKETYRELANLFEISEGACCRFIHQLSAVFAKYLVPIVIKWPTPDEKIEISVGIEEAKRFPHVIGMIDGCHIPIKKPCERGELFYNRKDFHSIILQAVCREDLRFTNIYAGFPGRVHDARVFDASPLFTQGAVMCENYVLLGDSAYPNIGWLLTPFKENMRLSPNMRHYNTVHSSVRTSIERAFGHLKGRFRRLKYLEQTKMGHIVHVVASACVLHNICIMKDDAADYFDPELGVPVAILPPGVFGIDTRERCLVLRNRIMNTLARH